MGLIKAAMGAAGGVLADQWKEYFYCESMPADVLVTKAHKKVSGRSSNKHGSENIISNGSVIAVNDGQCMLIVEQGKVVDVCAEPGEYMILPQSHPSSAEDWEPVSRQLSSRLASVLPLAENHRRIREFILSIPRSLSETNTVHQIRFRSAWWI